MNLPPLLRALLLALSVSFASAPGAQDLTGLASLPQGRAQPAVIRAEAMRAKSMSPSTNHAPMASADPVLGVSRPVEPGRAAARRGCEGSTADLCYDMADNHIVYRPARQYMPSLKGLTADNISLRRNGVRLKYTFP